MPLNPPIRHWSGQRAWIVGASSGIGAALARALLARDVRVAASVAADRILSTFLG